jgi:hypothetical protein
MTANTAAETSRTQVIISMLSKRTRSDFWIDVSGQKHLSNLIDHLLTSEPQFDFEMRWEEQRWNNRPR